MTNRVDWPQLALAIRRKGKPLQKASREIGKHKGWLSQLARGEIADPYFHDGLELIEYAHVTNDGSIGQLILRTQQAMTNWLQGAPEK